MRIESMALKKLPAKRFIPATSNFLEWLMRAILRSPVAHAKVVKVDASKAKNCPASSPP